MAVEVHGHEELAERAAEWIAARMKPAVAARGRFTLAVSGGSTPAAMFAALSQLPLPWEQVHVFQVDERVAPDGDPDRNLGDLSANLLDRVPVAGAPDGRHRPRSRGRRAPLCRGRSGPSPATVCSTWCTWVSATTATPRRGRRAIRSSMSTTPTSHSPSRTAGACG